MVREQIRADYTHDELENIKQGKCWCGVPRDQFQKGMRVYCSPEHRSNWYARTVHWSTFRDEVIAEKGLKCVKCGKTKDTIQTDYEKDVKAWIEMIKSRPDLMKILEEERLEKLKHIEDEYQKALDTDYMIDWVFRGYKGNDVGVPKPDEPHFISNQFEADHIVAVSLGGDMWDKDNIQILCNPCHKIKTKEDMKKLRAQK